MDWDMQMISRFIGGLNLSERSGYFLQSQPDKDGDGHKAVDAIYTDPSRGNLAIEHTRIEPFVGALAYEQGPFRVIPTTRDPV